MNIMYVHTLLPIHAPTRPSKRYLLLQWNDVWNANFFFQKKTGSTEQLTCYFDEINTSKTCNMTLREKLSLADIKSNYPEQYKNSKSHHYHPIYRSDYINVVGGFISTCLIFQTLHKSLLIFVNNVISRIHICSW